jgi:predicted nucleotidyltransferase
MPEGHGLSETNLATIRGIFAPFADKIAQVGIFGSRATGTYRNNSDIDLVVYGKITQTDIDRIWTLFDTSNLPIKVDIIAYDLISYPKLKAHIDSFMVPLFTQLDLQAEFQEK